MILCNVDDVEADFILKIMEKAKNERTILITEADWVQRFFNALIFRKLRRKKFLDEKEFYSEVPDFAQQIESSMLCVVDTFGIEGIRRIKSLKEKLSVFVYAPDHCVDEESLGNLRKLAKEFDLHEEDKFEGN